MHLRSLIEAVDPKEGEHMVSDWCQTNLCVRNVNRKMSHPVKYNILEYSI